MPNASQRNPVSRSIDALRWLIETSEDHVGVRQLATALSVTPSGAHRMLSSLCESGLVEKTEDAKRYRLSPDLYRLAQIAVARAPITKVALPHIRSLAAACDETVILGLYDGSRHEMTFAACVESTAALRYAIALNSWMPLHAGASGLGILAFLPETVRQTILEAPLRAETERTLLEPQALSEEMDRIRRRGYAITFGQRIVGAVGIAAPIMGAGGAVVGDIVVTMPDLRFTPDREAALAASVMACAASIGAALGR